MQGLRVQTSDPVEGRLGALLDGLRPFRAGGASWPAGAPAKLELRWDRVEDVREVRLYQFTLGRRNEMDVARDLDESPEVTVTWSGDGFQKDLRSEKRSVRAEYQAFPTYKGCIEAQKLLRIPVEGVKASGVRLVIPPTPTDWRGEVVALSEVEVLAEGRGLLAIHHLKRVDLDGDGRPEWLVNVGDGVLSLLDADGKRRWQKTFAGEVSGVDVGDLDGDGKQEVLASCYDMCVYAFRSDGSLLWKSDSSAWRKQRPDLFGRLQSPDAGPVPFGVGFWEPKPGIRRVMVGGYETTLCVLDERGALLQVYYPDFSMFHRSFIPGQVDMDGDGLKDKVMCSMKYGAYGVVHVLLAAADGRIAGNRNTAIPDNLPYVHELVGPKKSLAAVITPTGFGLYDLSRNFPEQQRGGLNAVWAVTGGRPISAGLVHDLDGDGVEEFIAGGSDGFLSVFSQDGQSLRTVLVGDEVRDLAALGTRDRLVATARGILVYDADWRLVAVEPGSYARLRVADPTRRTVLAATDDARLRLLQLPP